MEPGITRYDVLGARPGAEAAGIRREYDAKMSLPRPPAKRQRPGPLTIHVSHPSAR